MEKNQAYEIAKDAVERVVEDLGADTAFPFDLIWQYAQAEVPSTQRPHQWKRLVEEGYLELTGKYTKASSPDRAGSPTREYRPGARFRDQPEVEVDMPPSVATALRALEVSMDGLGFITTAAELANFYLALMASPIVILAGLSGTGKSLLPRLFSGLIDASFTCVSVQPQWSDNADLLGYTSSLAPSLFVEGRFTQVLRAASENPGKPVIVLLDEMNLAAVEHYFSDFLSVVETRRKVEGEIVTDPLPLDLPAPTSDDEYHQLRGLHLPFNVRVVGTANMDETTRAFSPKVLDRSFVIEFDEVDLTAFPSLTTKEVDESHFSVLAQRLVDKSNPVAVREVYASSQVLFDSVAVLLEQIRGILRAAGISLGYRTRDAILLYTWHWQRDDLSTVLSLDAAFDFCVLQKVLPKISGTSEALREALERLVEWLEQDRGNDETADQAYGTAEALIGVRGPFLRSAEKVKLMLQRLNAEGATTYWGL